MVSRYTKLRIKRKVRHQQKAIEQVGTDANRQFEYHVVRRWRNLVGVRRFVVGWLILVAILAGGVYLQNDNLSANFQSAQPVAGGTYREGIVGEFTNINPIYASTNSDRSAAKLIFSNLFKYNHKGEIVNDLAKNWKVNKDGTVYTVSLRQDAKWHDDTPLTAEDVVFTYSMIQNPDVKSVLNASWRGIKVQAKDRFTLTFTLPNSFAPFLHSLTKGGILPKHILGEVNPEQMRSNQFNTVEPVGSGPFSYLELARNEDRNELRLKKNSQYYLGEPNINLFYLISYDSQDEMISDFNGGELAAIGGLKGVKHTVISQDRSHVWNEAPLTNGVYLFLKNSDKILADKDMRVALTKATNRADILKALDSSFLSVDSALLRGQIGYDPEFVQHRYDSTSASKMLNGLGWKKRSDGWRYKDKERLSFIMTTQNSDYYPQVAEEIKRQWAKIGINLEVQLVDESTIQNNHIIPHNYQIFLSGIEIGHDPDVYVFWHSSQAEIGGYNLSEYKSDVADSALENGRTRSDETLRDAKYRPFIQVWAQDAPAIGIYQPTYIYVQQARADGYKPSSITAPEDKFNNVSKWFINTEVKDIPY